MKKDIFVKIKLVYLGAYLNAPNMVKCGVPEKVLEMQFRCVGLRSIGPPVKSYDQISFSPDRPIVIQCKTSDG